MSKAVMISIQPKWVEKIANGEKTIEVRKTKPNINTPFKCYIYCTSIKAVKLNDYVMLHRKTGGAIDYWHGKVIGEFICDKIEKIECWSEQHRLILNDACLTLDNIIEYCTGKDIYAWHISNLIVYDEPKELGEFCKASICKHLDGGCDCWHELCAIAQNNDCHCGHIRLTRPPQSWCYVMERGEDK